jgi:tRNA-specific 2-thiouridylase
MPLFENALAVVVSKEHPLAARKDIKLHELVGKTLLLPSKGLQARTMLDRLTEREGVELHSSLELNETNILLQMIATGHYAIIEKDANGRYLLRKGADISKDQSYVLYVLNQHQLSHSVFPLGNLCKSEIREIAENLGFINANRKDSQDICFVPDGDYAAFIEKRTGKTYPCGDFVTRDGKILGQHKGIIRYTVGQRKGLGLALPAPMYVCEKDVENNRVILSDNETLFTKTLTAKNINLIPFDKINSSIRVKAKIRYAHREQWATVHQTDEDTLFVEFDEPVRAIAKGQSLVMYDSDYVVGGGIIK